MTLKRTFEWVIYLLGVIISLVEFFLVHNGAISFYEAIFFSFAGLLAVALLVFVFSPSHDSEEATEKTRLTYLYERKDVIYENLRDLNFEHKAGKFSEADFITMRGAMEAEAAGVLGEIEKLEHREQAIGHS